MQIEFVVDAKKANEMVGFIFIMMRCVSMEMRDGEHMLNFFFLQHYYSFLSKMQDICSKL